MRDERNRKYVIDLAHPHEVIVVSSDDDGDEPKKGKGKAAAGKTVTREKAGTKSGTKEGKLKTPTKEVPKKEGSGRPPHGSASVLGSSSSPATGGKRPTKKSTADGKSTVLEGNKALPRTTGRKMPGTKRGTASLEDYEGGSPKKHLKAGGKSAWSKSGKSASSEPSGSKSNPTTTRSTPTSVSHYKPSSAP